MNFAKTKQLCLRFLHSRRNRKAIALIDAWLAEDTPEMDANFYELARRRGWTETTYNHEKAILSRVRRSSGGNTAIYDLAYYAHAGVIPEVYREISFALHGEGQWKRRSGDDVIHEAIMRRLGLQAKED